MVDTAMAIEQLRKDGYCVLEGLFSSFADKLSNEFDRAVSSFKSGRVISGGDKIYPVTISALINGRMTHLASALSAPWFAELGKTYFRLDRDPEIVMASLVSGEHLDDGCTKGNHQPHWDPALEIRLMLYVGDVKQENGALEVIPQTHWRNHELRITRWSENLDLDTDLDGTTGEFCPIEGRAGTVIIFDTSITHKRGLIGQGKSRKVGFSFVRSSLAEKYYNNEPCPASQDELWPHK